MRSFLQWASAIGFDGIDLSDSVVDFNDSPQQVRGLARLLDEHNLVAPTINCLRASLCDREFSELSTARVRAALRAAEVLGTEVVNISLAVPRQRLDCNQFRGSRKSPGSSCQANDDDFALTVRRLAELVSVAESLGVLLTVEMHHCSLADTSTSTLRLIRAVSSPTLGCNPDIVNMYWAYSEPEEDWLEGLERMAPMSNLWHVKNVRRIFNPTAKTSAYIDAPLHSGDIDYRLASAVMWRAGFPGWVSIERGGPGDFLFTAAEGYSYLRQLANDWRRQEEGSMRLKERRSP